MSVLRKENSGLDAMIDKNSVSDLSRLYSLYEKVPGGVPAIRRAIKESIVRRGTALNTVTNGEREAVGVDEEAEAVQGKGKGKAKAVEEHISAEMIDDSGDEHGAGMQLGDAPQPQHEPGLSTPSASSSKSVDEPAEPKPGGTHIF